MSHPQVRFVTVSADDDGMRLDNYLMRELKGVPKSHVYRIIRSGEVRIDKGRVKPNSRLSAGCVVRIPPVRTASRSAARPPDALIDRVLAAIIHERDGVMALNKPAGLAVHGGSGVSFGLIEVLRHARADDRLELVHRIDRETSGLLLVAQGRKVLGAMQAALNAEAAEKRYLALVHGAWPESLSRVTAPLERDRERGGERMVEVAEGGRRAESFFAIQRQFADSSLLNVRITTGRTHQIRVHAAHNGHPVLGDDKYGDREANQRARDRGLKRMFLHAWRLRLPGLGPSGAALELEAPLAPELVTYMESLGKHS